MRTWVVSYDYGVVGLYAVDGGVVGAVSGAVLGVVGEGGRGLAGGEPNKQQDNNSSGYQILCKLYCRGAV